MADYSIYDKTELLKIITKQEKELKAKKYGLVWDSEREQEQVVLDCENNLPVLKRIKNKEIRTDDGEDNILIEGDNYHALTVLNYTHKEKIDVIYIDPPYNTGNKDFIYNDRFVEKEDGYRHSKWLNFMEKRLNLANELLKKDGVIFISIDDNEESQLKLLCDKIFGEENFLLPLYIQVRYPGKTLVEDADIQKIIEKVLVYGKTANSILNKKKIDYSYHKFIWKIKEVQKPVEIINLGGKRVEIFKDDCYEIIKSEASKNNLKEIWASGKILDGNSSGRFFRDYFQGRYEKDGYKVLYKVYDIGNDKYSYRYFTGPKRAGATKGKYYQGVPNNILENPDSVNRYAPIINFENFSDSFGNCSHEGNIIFRSGKKPIAFLKYLLKMGLRKEYGIILDFFAGSGSTGHAVLDLNNELNNKYQFILCTNNEDNNGNAKISEDVCWPRIRNVIVGYNGSKGLNGNLQYFKTDLIKKTKNRDQVKINLTKKSTEMLCVKENIFNLETEEKDFKIFSSNKNDKFLCIYYNFVEDTFDGFLDKLKKLNGKKIIYMFSMENEVDKNLFSGIKNIKIGAIPQNILNVYKQLVKMNIPIKTNVIFTDLNKAKTKVFAEKEKDDGARVLRIVLEKLIQKISQDNNINILNAKGKEEKISVLNDKLFNQNIITKVEYVENRVCFTIGNNAAHGDYDDYDLKHVEKFYKHIQSLLNSYNV